MVMTRNEPLSILGPTDEATIAEIVPTGASAEELRTALAWLFSDEAMIGEGRPLPRTRVARLIDLLKADEEDVADSLQVRPAPSH